MKYEIQKSWENEIFHKNKKSRGQNSKSNEIFL